MSTDSPPGMQPPVSMPAPAPEAPAAPTLPPRVTPPGPAAVPVLPAPAGPSTPSVTIPPSPSVGPGRGPGTPPAPPPPVAQPGVTATDTLPRPWDTVPTSAADTPGGVDGLPSARRRRVERYGEPVSLVSRAAAVTVTVGGSLVTLCRLVWVVWERRGLVGDLADGVPVARDRLVAADDRVATAVIALLVTMVVGAPAVMAWMHRAYRNVGAWRPIDHGVGWAVGGWLMPVLNLFRPARIMTEIVESSPVTGRPAGLVWWWWVVWLASWVALAVVGTLEAATTTDFIRREALAIGAAALLGLAAVLLLVIVARATLDQRRRLAADTGAQPLGAPPR